MISDTSNVEKWFLENKPTINKIKTATFDLSRQKFSNNRSNKSKNEKLTFKTRIDKTLRRAAKCCLMIFQLRFYVNTSTLLKIYKTYVQPINENIVAIYSTANETDFRKPAKN